MKLGALLATVLLTVRVAAALNVVTESAIHQAAQAFVQAELAGKVDPQEHIEIHARWQGDIALDREGATEVKIRRISSRPFRGPTVVRAEILVDGETQRTLTLTVDTRFNRKVLVTTRSLRREQSFSSDMVEWVERDITDLEDGFFTDFAELADLQVKRPIGFDRILTHRHVEKIPVVRRGDEVVLVVATSHLRISTQGMALQDGAVGKRIRVRNQDSGKVVQGEILDRQTVRVR